MRSIRLDIPPPPLNKAVTSRLQPSTHSLELWPCKPKSELMPNSSLESESNKPPKQKLNSWREPDNKELPRKPLRQSYQMTMEMP